MESDISVLEGKANLEDGAGVGLRPTTVQAQSCRFCSASFSSEIELLLHFHQEHFIPQKKKQKRKQLSDSSTVSAKDDDDNYDDDDEFDSDLESSPPANKENESQEIEDKPMTSSNFLTEYEELLLQNPVLDPNSTEDEESDTEPEVEDDEDCWKGSFPLEKSDLNGTTGTKSEVVTVESSSGACDMRRQKRTLDLLRLLRAPEDKSAHRARPNLRSSSRPQGKPVNGKGMEEEAKKRFECLFCEKSYVREKLLFDHIRKQHSREEPYFCKLCDRCFSNTDDLTKHMKIFHAGMTPYKCKSCSATFSTQSQLLKHMPTHLTERKFGCPYCKIRFRDNYELNRHMKRCHAGMTPYKCKSCSATFSIHSQLVKHLQKHRKFECPYCKMEFRDNYDLTRHIAVRHPEMLTHCCDICEKGFQSRERLQNHMNRWHANDEGKQFECEHCRKRFAYNRSKNAHIRQVHG